MDMKTMHKLSYGLFVLTAHQDGKDNGCIINTAVQMASEPNRVCISVNKANYTTAMIQATRKFTVSILSEEAEFSTFQHFGFQSGKNVNKFAAYAFEGCKRVPNGTMAITKGTNGYLSVWVEQEIDLGSHILFIGQVTDAVSFNDVPSATYAYYHANIKPQPKKDIPVGTTADGKTIWRCTICGYEYVGEELPEDFICPLCKHPASDFEKVTG